MPTQEKSKEQLLQELQASFEKYGIRDAEIRLESGKLIIEQKLGSGVRGLGYDKEEESLWMCLDQNNPESIANNQKWNANTLFWLFAICSG